MCWERSIFLYFCRKLVLMKKGFSLVYFLLTAPGVFAQNEIGPDGDKLLYIGAFVVVLVVVFVWLNRSGKSKTKNRKRPFFQYKRIQLELEKDRLYYPDVLTVKVKNTGNVDLDLDRPLLVFDNFWLKRKFKIKGVGNYCFYPLYLEKGKTHTLEIDINRFYGHDKRLKRYPKVKIYITDVKKRRLASKSLFLRKTLFKF